MSTTVGLFRTPRALRLCVATAVIALAGGLSQAVLAAQAVPHEGHGRGGPGMGMFDARHAERLLDAVDATPDQRAQVKQILQAAEADITAPRESGRKLHAQGQALFAQPTVDARAAETLRQQQMAQHDQTSKRTLQLMLDVSRVLTPEQRKTLSERMAQRRSMMERHRAERDTMERAPR